MPPERDLASAQAWLEYADADLNAAETLRAGGAEPNNICFHCQQAAEKAYKAYLAWLGDESIPRVHDLEYLTGRILAQGGAQPPAADLDQLTEYVITGRYPGVEPITPEEVEPALALAREVLAWVRQAIGLEE
ncbi:MAG TPA: HEPN domain-containing protein [Armatimonadota bacterium]|jgi:HEPN domain-containing protein